MKKLLHLTLVCLLAIVSGQTFAQEVVLDFTTNTWNLPVGSSNKGTEAKEFSNGTYTITLEAGSGYYFNDKDGYLMLGKKDATLTLPAFDFAVGKIEVEGTGGASASVKQNIYVGDQAVSTETTGAKDVTNVYAIASEYQAAGTIYTFKVTSSHNTQIKTIKVYKATGKKAANLQFSEEKATVALNGTFTEPTLTKETTASVTYSSDAEDVATVDAATGKVTLVGEGTARITAKAEANDEYDEGTASYLLTVTAPVYSEVGLPYNESFKDGIGSFTIDDVNLSEGLSYVWRHDADQGYMKASAYVGENKAAESWLVSPTINLEGVDNATLSFTQTINAYFGKVEDEATLWISVDGGEWEQIAITYPEIAEGSNWSKAEAQEIDLKAYVGKKIKVGFKYVSTAEAAGTWEVEAFSVKTVLPVYEEVTPPYSEDFKAGIGSFTIDNVNLSEGLEYVWNQDNEYGMKASAYVGSNKAAESWLVSPTINLENAEDATMKFTQAINKYFGNVANEATLWIKEDGGQWEQIVITYPELGSESSFSDFEEQTVSLKAYAGKKIKVGFKYVSTEEAAGTWEIGTFSVTTITSGINAPTVEELDENAPVYNLAGQRVSKGTKGILIQNGKKFINK